jgi:hypothetical protein
MDYELAKELKEAGFPQQIAWGQFVFSVEGKLSICTRYKSDRDCTVHANASGMVLAPTLSELIEACGDNFGQVFKRSYGDERAPWGAFDNAVVTEANGSTPSEAVARLWLALQSRSKH